MNDRTKSILQASVKHFIETGIPITSANLYESFDFGIRPAMIRCELNELGESGYLTQIHPSGGRLPTHKAYRFFVNEIIKDLNEENNYINTNQTAISLTTHLSKGKTKTFIEELSNHLEALSVGYFPESDIFYDSGLSELFQNFEFSGQKSFLDILEDIDHLDDKLEKGDWWKNEMLWPKVFIGESPVTKSKDLSVIADRFETRDGNFLLCVVGPNRMDYEKSLKLLKSMEKIFG